MVKITEAEISDYVKVDIKIPSNRSPAVVKALNLDPGQGFEVKGLERAELAHALKETKKAGMVCSTRKLGKLHYLFFRVS